MDFCNVCTLTCFTGFYSGYSAAVHKEYIYLLTASEGHAISVDRILKDKAENHKESLPSTETGSKWQPLRLQKLT